MEGWVESHILRAVEQQKDGTILVADERTVPQCESDTEAYEILLTAY